MSSAMIRIFNIDRYRPHGNLWFSSTYVRHALLREPLDKEFRSALRYAMRRNRVIFENERGYSFPLLQGG